MISRPLRHTASTFHLCRPCFTIISPSQYWSIPCPYKLPLCKLDF